MKKNILLTVFTALLVSQLSAQQLPVYTQLYFMRMLYNPALTAYNGSTNIYGYYRDQWTGVEGHPVTGGGMGEISLWKDRIGIGANIYEDNTSIIHNFNAQVYGAYKQRIAEDHLISIGVAVGAQQTRR